MMKRFLSLCLLMILVLAPFAFADTTRTGSFSQGFDSMVGLGDISSGTTVEVTSVGGLASTDKAVAVSEVMDAGGSSLDTLIYTGACNVLGIYVTGESAGDWVAIYDAITADITALKFDPRISANTSSEYFDAKGAPFTTGIYANVLDSDVKVTIVYDY